MSPSAMTIEDLQAASASAGDVMTVLGYHAAGDMGGGSFYLESPPPPAATVVNAVDVSVAIARITADSPTSPIIITTSAAHRYRTGQVVAIRGTHSTLDAAWTVTVIDATRFTLDNSTGHEVSTSGTGTSNTTTITTSVAHGLPAGQSVVMIAGVGGNTAANGT